MTRLKIGVIGVPGKWSTETLADAVEKKTGFRHVIDMSVVHMDLTTKRVYAGQVDLCAYDALLVKKISAEYNTNTLDRLELLRIVESAGVRVFSKPLNIQRLIDRLSCTVTLSQHNIPMPPTVVTEDIEQALICVANYQSAIFKPLYSTKARGMIVISSSSPVAEQRQQIIDFKASNPMMYIQKKLALPGQDMGLVFLAGKYLGAYARVSHTDSWNTTIHSGGKYQACDASADIVKMAHKAQAAFGMDFTTVDVAESDIGTIVFEVSAFGGFRGAKEGMGLDVASLYADYAIEQLEKENV